MDMTEVARNLIRLTHFESATGRRCLVIRVSTAL
jgi:hypothetical protein